MARILFVDDEPDTLETLKRAVELFGHQAILAKSGQDAILKASELCPDLCILDMQLPDMDGLELTGRLRANFTTDDIPVIILSAGPEIDSARRARAAGALTYLLKPVALQTLLDVIEKSVNPTGFTAT